MIHRKSILNSRELRERNVRSWGKHDLEFYLDFLSSLSDTENRYSEEEVAAYIKKAKSRFSKMVTKVRIKDVK